MNSSPWMSPALSLIPWAWVIVRPCEIIGAFNANGSPAHSLFSPGNRVLQSVMGPMSYCSAWTNLILRGKWQKPTALSPPLSPSLYVSSASLCPSEQADRHHTENSRLYHSCGVVRRPVMGVVCGCRQNDRRSGALLCHCSAWPQTAMTGGERLFPVLQPSWDCCGIYEESGVRNAAGGGGLRGWLTCR